MLSSTQSLSRALQYARDEADACEDRGRAYSEAGHGHAASREFARRVQLDRRVVSLTTALGAAEREAQVA